MDVFNFLIENYEGIGILAVGGMLIWQRFSSGSSALRKEINEEYKERNRQLDEKVKECIDKINATNLEVARLTGVIQEKDKHIESLTKILQGRNPELLELLKEIKEGNSAIQEFMKTTYTLLAKSSEELGYQTELLEGSKVREEKIDQASQEHTGVPVRVPVKAPRVKP